MGPENLATMGGPSLTVIPPDHPIPGVERVVRLASEFIQSTEWVGVSGGSLILTRIEC